MSDILSELITITIATTIICVICSSLSFCCFICSPLITNLKHLPLLFDSMENNYEDFKIWLECTFSLNNLKDTAVETVTPEWYGAESKRSGSCVFPLLSSAQGIELKEGGEICSEDAECKSINSEGKGKCNCSRGGLSNTEAKEGGYCRCEYEDDITNLPDLAYCPSGKDESCVSGWCACPYSDFTEDSSGGACRCLPTDSWTRRDKMDFQSGGDVSDTGWANPMKQHLTWAGLERKDHVPGSVYPSDGDLCNTGEPHECPSEAPYCRCNLRWEIASIGNCKCASETRLREAGQWTIYDR